MINLHPLCHYANSTHCAKLCPQNGERVVTIDSVTSFHPVYNDGAFQTDEAPTLASFAESASASGVVVGRTMRSSTICQTIVTHVTVVNRGPGEACKVNSKVARPPECLPDTRRRAASVLSQCNRVTLYMNYNFVKCFTTVQKNRIII